VTTRWRIAAGAGVRGSVFSGLYVETQPLGDPTVPATGPPPGA
jgi:hypothetical protein